MACSYSYPWDRDYSSCDRVHCFKSRRRDNHLSRQKIDCGNIEQLTNDSITPIYTVHDNKVYFQKVLPSDYYLFELDLDTKAVQGLIKNTSVAGLSYINITGKYIFLSGAAPESVFIDMVRIPIDSKRKSQERKDLILDP